jgi:hypothetical protein
MPYFSAPSCNTVQHHSNSFPFLCSDVKPDNFLRVKGRAKVADLGMAVPIEDSWRRVGVSHVSATKSNAQHLYMHLSGYKYLLLDFHPDRTSG